MKLLLLLTLLISTSCFSQYCNTATTNDAITPTTTVQYSTTYNSARRAFNFSAVAGNEYTFSTVGETSVDTYLRLYSTGTGGSVLAESDDYNNTQSEITWYCSVSGTYSILLTRWTSSSSCANLNANARIKYQMGTTAGSTVVSIGNGEGTVYVVPAYHYYKYNWSQMIYLQSEINTAGSITKIRFQVDPASPVSYTATNQKIYMAHTTYATLPSVVVKENAQANYASSNYTLVYDGTIVWIPGWVEIVLSTPFPWNNTDNLLIKYENRSGSWSSSYPGFYYTSKTATVGYQYADASYPTSDGTRDGFRPNIKLLISDPSPLPIELLNFTATKHGSSNLLNWKTATEHNNSYFTLERGVYINDMQWESIATIQGSGNSIQENEYRYADFSYQPAINYYRLTQTDFDGQTETFPVISIDNRVEAKYVIKYINSIGQEVATEQEAAFILYSDGTAEKVSIKQ
jgi:hypothetical protein